MKQFRLSIAALLFTMSLAGTAAVAQRVANANDGSGERGVKVLKSENKKVRLYTPAAESPTGTPVEVAIIDADGNVLYRSTNRQQKALSFNLANLPDGQYYLTASNNAWWMSQGLTIRGNVLNVDARSMQRVAQPTLTAYEPNKIEVSLPATNLSRASVAIYDAQRVPVYADTFPGPVGRFDLSALPDGTYTFVVGPDQKQFSSRVNIRH